MTAWVPFAELAGGVWRDGVQPILYDGGPDVPSSPDTATVFVPPHPFMAESLAVLPDMRGLKVLQLLSSGVDHVLPYLPHGVTLCNAPDLHAAPTAETAMSLILASLNDVPAWVTSQSEAVWKDPGPRLGLTGKTVVLAGYGAVGRKLAAMLAGFDVTLIPVARRARPGVTTVEELPRLLPMADVLVIAAPLTSATKGLIGHDALTRLPDGALVVNVSRGPLVDADALLAHARSGRIRAALDVTDPDPLPDGHPLWRCPGVLISPHVGGNMADFKQRAISYVSEQLHRYDHGLPLLNVVSDPAC